MLSAVLHNLTMPEGVVFMAISRLKLKIKEIEVECASPAALGNQLERIRLMLTVVRGPRGRRKLLGEAFTRQVYHPIIHFKVFDDESVETLFNRFLGQLIHRGYRPVKFRELDREDRWGEWDDCDLSNFDLDELEDAAAAPMGLDEDNVE